MVILFTMSCESSSSKKEGIDFKIPEKKIKTSHTDIVLYEAGDTTVFFKFVDDGNGVILFWGIDGQYENMGKDTLPFSHLTFNHTKKISNYFIIEDGCGTGCSYLYLMSFEKGEKGEIFLSPLLYDFNREVIVYQDESEKHLVLIEGIKTGKVIAVERDFYKGFRPYSLAVDTLFFTKKDLFISWRKADDKIMKEKIDISEVLR